MAEQKISDVPMVTCDDVDINLDTILYTTSWSSGYGYKKEGKCKIEAHRVISVDNSRRFFRTRCIKGCETEHSYGKGRCTMELFGKIENAADFLAEMVEADLKKCKEKLSNVKDTLMFLEGQLHDAKNYTSIKKVRAPRAVKK